MNRSSAVKDLLNNPLFNKQRQGNAASAHSITTTMVASKKPISPSSSIVGDTTPLVPRAHSPKALSIPPKPNLTAGKVVPSVPPKPTKTNVRAAAASTDTQSPYVNLSKKRYDLMTKNDQQLRRYENTYNNWSQLEVQGLNNRLDKSIENVNSRFLELEWRQDNHFSVNSQVEKDLNSMADKLEKLQDTLDTITDRFEEADKQFPISSWKQLKETFEFLLTEEPRDEHESNLKNAEQQLTKFSQSTAEPIKAQLKDFESKLEQAEKSLPPVLSADLDVDDVPSQTKTSSSSSVVYEKVRPFTPKSTAASSTSNPRFSDAEAKVLSDNTIVGKMVTFLKEHKPKDEKTSKNAIKKIIGDFPNLQNLIYGLLKSNNPTERCNAYSKELVEPAKQQLTNVREQALATEKAKLNKWMPTSSETKYYSDLAEYK